MHISLNRRDRLDAYDINRGNRGGKVINLAERFLSDKIVCTCISKRDCMLTESSFSFQSKIIPNYVHRRDGESLLC